MPALPCTTAPLLIAVCADVLTAPLASLLAQQRAEEPETPVCLVETTVAEQRQGLGDGRYCLGLSAAPTTERHTLQTLALWREELAVAVPLRSPLLAFAEIPLEEAVQYPLVMWSQEGHEALNQQIDPLLALVKGAPRIVERVTSFDLMAALVAAGYGIGFHTKSRISASRRLNIVMRPLAGEPHHVTTFLLKSRQPHPATVDRLIQRALYSNDAMRIMPIFGLL